MQSNVKIPLLFCFIMAGFFCGCDKTKDLFSFGLANNQDIHAIVNYNESVTFTTTSPATWYVANPNLGTVTTDGKFTAGNSDGFTELVATSIKDPTLKLYMLILINHNASILKDMVKGGYVLSFRHTDATLGADSFGALSSEWWKSCNSALARQLTLGKGDIDADSIGRTLQLLQTFGVQFDTVRTSEYCRCKQTVERFNLVNVAIKESSVLTYFVYDEVNRYQNTMAFYASLPLNNKNHLAVTHAGFTANLPSNPYLNLLQPGDAALFKKQAGGTMAYMATITLQDWHEMNRR
jgi:phosphohistidine phosphatase SixA